MMTTEVQGGKTQLTKDRSLNFNSQRIGNHNRPTDFLNPNFSDENLTPCKDVPRKPMIDKYGKLSLPTDKHFIINHQDEGYNTDSKSNTSPSTTSPLSSSFSSMSTFDGSFNSPTSPSGGVSPNGPNTSLFVMQGSTQRCLAPQKLSLIQGNGKIHVNRHAFVMAKKRDSPQEIQDNSPVNLEDRLRALTTIEEEDPASSNISTRDTQKKEVYNVPEFENFNSRHTQPITNNGNRIEDFKNRGDDQNTGFFRAVPVEIAAPLHSYDQRSRTENRNENLSDISSAQHTDNSRPIPNSPGYNSYDKNWHDYRRYFEKDCDIPLRNIDAFNRGKFVTVGLDSANEKDINRQLGTNTSEVRSGQVAANVSSIQPHGVKSSPHGDLNESVGEVLPPGHFHGHPLNGHRLEDRFNGQTAPSASMSELHFPYQRHPNPQSSNDNSYYPNDHLRSQPEQSQSLPQAYQQPQLDTRQPHHQNQYFQQHYPFFNEQSQQNPNALFQNSHNRSFGSYNSLPRHYENQRQHPMFYPGDSSQFSENDVVLRRSWASSSTRAIPDRVDRSSWHPESRSKQSNPTSNDRYSLDLGNIPQLQQQIRATSEMCLQASKRHVFASSADIYKLFQGQKKPLAPSSSPSPSSSNLIRGQNQSHRHSFHAMPGGSWTKSQQSLHQDPNQISQESVGILPTSSRQHGFYLNNPPHHSPSPGPLRGDHSIPLPQTSLGGNAFPQLNSSPSIFPSTLSELPHIQRQSSGYSSENELQQIEQNAKAAKKVKARTHPHSQQGFTNSDQEFVPVDPSQDHDSSSSIIDNEPVYVNQPMLASATGRGSIIKSSPIQQSQSSSTPPPPPLPARPKHLQQTPVANINFSTATNLQVSQHSTINSSVDNQPGNEHDTSPSPAVITQKQIIHFNQKPVTINSFVPNHPFNTNSNSSTNGPTIDERRILPGGQVPSIQPLNFQSNHDQFLMEQKLGPDFLNAPKRSNSSRSNRTNSSPCTPLSPLEIAQVLDTPFATNVISDKCGDRLSTLV